MYEITIPFEVVIIINIKYVNKKYINNYLRFSPLIPFKMSSSDFKKRKSLSKITPDFHELVFITKFEK